MTKFRQKIILLVIMLFFVALALRLWGIGNGLPPVQRPDEVGDIAQALQIVDGQTPTYAYHRVAWSMVQIPLHGMHFMVNKLRFPNYSIADFEASYYLNRDVFILSTRIYLAIFSALTCVLVGFTGYLLTKNWWAFAVSTVLLVVHPAHVYLSHIALPDAFSTFGVALCLLCVVLIIKKGYRLAYVIAGAAAALAMLARLQVLPLVITPIALAHFVFWWKLPQRSWQYLFGAWLWALLGFIGAHLIFNPFILLQPRAVWNDILFIFNERYTGTNNWQAEYATYRPLTNILSNSSLPIIFLRPYFIFTFVCATIGVVVKRNIAALVLSAVGWLFIIILLPTTIPRITFWLPATIPLSIVIGWFVWHCLQSFQRQVQVMGAIILLVAFLPALVETVKIDHTLAQPDTQSLAYDYITHEIPANSSILIGDTFVYSVPLERNRESIKRLEQIKTLPPSYQFFLDSPDQLPTPAYDIYGYEYISNIQSDAEMRAFVEEHDIDYIVEVDYCGGTTPYNFVSGLTFPAITDAIRGELQFVYSVSPFVADECLQHIENRTHMEYMRLWDWQRVGPIIRVYQPR